MPKSGHSEFQGSFRYWVQKRYELIARMEQFGPFHIFFTLSCAEKRWPENFTSILRQEGKEITYEDDEETGETKIMVEGVPLEEYLDSDMTKKLLKENVLTVAKNFDKRVKAFMSQIVLNDNAPLKVLHYTYRTEFQNRGHGHIHGCLWLDLEALEDKFPNISTIFRKIKNSETLDEDEEDEIASFVDEFITCSIDSSVAPEVQPHSHKKTCKKRGNFCRFHYPKYPSEKTFRTTGQKNLDEKDEERVKFLKDILKKAKEELTKMKKEELEEMTFDKFFEKLNISREDYYSALKISTQGIHELHLDKIH